MVPAQAGVVRARSCCSSVHACGPRAGGGGPFGDPGIRPCTVWSPRRRGWSAAGSCSARRCAVVPAQAGVVRARFGCGHRFARGPRAGGGGPTVLESAQSVPEWSPRRRGWSDPPRDRGAAAGVVPAQAGVVLSMEQSTRSPRCGPRAGGGGPTSRSGSKTAPLWSLRRRGWSRHGLLIPQVEYVVPAQAGVVRRVWPRHRTGRRGPRAGGGGPTDYTQGIIGGLWSPRRRGWSERLQSGLFAACVVPAQAGVVR